MCHRAKLNNFHSHNKIFRDQKGDLQCLASNRRIPGMRRSRKIQLMKKEKSIKQNQWRTDTDDKISKQGY